MNRPKVSVLVAAFNSEKFICAALDGILRQRVPFPIEIIVHDDASTDGTAGIIEQYAQSNPLLLRGIYQEQNQYQKGVRILPLMLEHARGEYVALCDADDVWTHPEKLSRQVAILDASPDSSIIFCNVQVVYEDVDIPAHLAYTNRPVSHALIPVRKVPAERTSIEDLAWGNYIHTPGVVFRNLLSESDRCHLHDVSIGDWPTYMAVATQGDILFCNECWARYRVHGGGVFSTLTTEKRLCKALGQYQPMLASGLYAGQVRKILIRKCGRLIAGAVSAAPAGDGAMAEPLCWAAIACAYPEIVQSALIEAMHKDQKVSFRDRFRMRLQRLGILGS